MKIGLLIVFNIFILTTFSLGDDFFPRLDEDLSKQQKFGGGGMIPKPNGGYVSSHSLLGVARTYSKLESITNKQLCNLLEHADVHIRYLAFSTLRIRGESIGVELKYFPLQDPKTKDNQKYLKDIYSKMPKAVIQAE